MALTILKVGNFDMMDELVAELKARGDFFELSKLQEPEKSAIMAKTDIVVASGGSIMHHAEFEAMPQLKGIVCFSVGFDGIDLNEANQRNIFVTNTPDVLNEEVANTAMLLLLACTRQFKAAQEFIENGSWEKQQSFPLTYSIEGKRLGIAGLGRIGKAIARRAAVFNMEIGYYGRHQQSGVDYPYFSSIKDLAQWCDCLMLIMPASPENQHCVNLEVLEALGKEGYLINVARGSQVKTDDLIYALDHQLIAGAALDVFEAEPNVPHEFFKRHNVALMPHLGSATVDTRMNMGNLGLANLDAILQGQPVKTPVPGTRTK